MSLIPSCKAQDTLQYGKILTKLLSFIFKIIKSQLIVFFNHRILVLSATFKINTCKKTKSYRFVQTNVPEMSFFRLVKISTCEN